MSKPFDEFFLHAYMGWLDALCSSAKRLQICELRGLQSCGEGVWTRGSNLQDPRSTYAVNILPQY